MKNSTKGIAPLILILIVVGVLALVGGGYYVYQNAKIKVQNERVEVPTQNQQANQQQQVVDETANGSTTLTTGWKTYRNERYGFEFKYPSEYPIQEYCSGCSVDIDTDKYFMARNNIEISAGFYPTTDVESYNNDHSQIGEKEILGQERIGDYTWNKYSYNRTYLKYGSGTESAYERRSVYRTFDDGLAVKFNKPSYFDDQIFKKIISSFRFIVPSSQRIDKKFNSLKVGDVFGDLKISYIEPSVGEKKFVSIENAIVGFNGQLALIGKYYFYGEVAGTLFCFNPDQQSLVKIPMILEWSKYQKHGDPFFCFSNIDSDEELSDVDPHYASSSVKITVLIDNLEERFRGDTINIGARLVRVLNSF